MRHSTDFIPDHSADGILESCDAALIRAGFYRLEQRELERFAQDRTRAFKANPQNFLRELRRRTRARKTRRFLTRSLPHAARAAACLVGALSICAGMAFAASASAREWAAGVLTSGYQKQEVSQDDLIGFEGFETPVPEGFQGGTMMRDGAYLLDMATHSIRRMRPDGGEPEVYIYAGDGRYEIKGLVCLGDELYMYCETPFIYDDELDKRTSSNLVYLFRVRLGKGIYTLTQVWWGDLNTFFGLPEGEPLPVSAGNPIAANGRIYLIADHVVKTDREWAFKLISIDPNVPGAETFPLPENPSQLMFPEQALFAGADNRLFLCDLFSSDGGDFDGVRIYRLEDDGSFSRYVDIPEQNGYAFGFAYSPERDSLIYVQNGSIYALRGTDASQAQRVGVTSEDYGDGLMLSANSYMLVNADCAQVFDLNADLSKITELKLGGASAYMGDAEKRFMEAHPNVHICGVGADAEGNLPADVDLWLVDADEFARHRAEDRYTPLEREAFEYSLSQMHPALQKFLSDDGALMGIPNSFDVQTDLSYDAVLLKQLGYTQADIDSWPKFLSLLSQISHSDSAASFPIFESSSASALGQTPAQYFARFLFQRMSNAFVRTCQAREVAPDFADARYRNLVEILKGIDFNAFQYSERGGYVPKGGACPPTPLFDAAAAPPVHCTAEHPCLSLKFSENDPATSYGHGRFFIVNPDSVHIDLAKAYLEEIVRSYDEFTLEAMYADMPMPYAEGLALRDVTGDVYTANLYAQSPNSETSRTICDDCLDALLPYLKGEAAFEDCAARMNAIVNG